MVGQGHPVWTTAQRTHFLKVSNVMKNTTVDSRARHTLRDMAWQRAKGELQAMLCTYWGAEEGEEFRVLNPLVTGFIQRVENETMLG